MYAISSAGEDLELSAGDFETAMERGALACGVRFSIEREWRVDAEIEARLARIESSGAQHLLRIQLLGGEKENGAIVVASYDVVLWDIAQKKRVWRAKINLKPDSDSYETGGERLARALMNRMVKDRVIGPTCYRMSPAEKQIEERKRAARLAR